MTSPSAKRTVTLTFDRGTVVASGAPAILSRVRGAGLLWDRRVGAFRAPGYRHQELRRALERAGATLDDQVLARAGRSLAGAVRPGPDLRGYQQRALEAWAAAGHRGLVVLPTGAGKTVVALAALAALQMPTLVLVPTRVLLAQWLEQLRQRLPTPVGVVGDGDHRVEPVTVTTFESAYRHVERFGDRFRLLVVDEAHHFGSGLRGEALESSPAPYRLGLTATPPERAEAEERLAQLIGPVVCTYTVPQLTGTHLAPYDHLCLHLELTPAERTAYRRARGAFQDAFSAFRRAGGRGDRWGEFVRSASVTEAGRAALAGFHESRRIVSTARRKLETVGSLLQRHLGDKALVFTLDNAAAYALSRRLLVPAITCDTKRAERADVLARLRRGELRAVVSARVLNEGLDLPDARVGIIVGGTATTREQVQRVGRLLRPGPDKRAAVYELVARNTFEERHAQKRQRLLLS